MSGLGNNRSRQHHVKSGAKKKRRDYDTSEAIKKKVKLEHNISDSDANDGCSTLRATTSDVLSKRDGSRNANVKMEDSTDTIDCVTVNRYRTGGNYDKSESIEIQVKLEHGNNGDSALSATTSDIVSNME